MNSRSPGPLGLGSGIGAGLAAMAVLCLPLASAARLVDGVAAYDPGADLMPPAKLSETGLYTDLPAKTRRVTAGIVPYEVNAALWSDGAHKQRWITLPPGTSVSPTDTDHYEFPDKTVMVKNFAVDTVVGDTSTTLLVETRFMVIRKNSGGYAYRGISYAWRRDQSDADLVDPVKGLDAIIAVKSAGASVGKRWRYPSRADCTACHVNRGSLGFITPQLNRPSRANASVNQLQELFSAGVLSQNPLAAHPHAVKWASLDNPTASLELRARSYLAANCSHCHGNGRREYTGVGHDFDYLNAAMVFKSDTANPFASGPYAGKPFFDPDFPMLVYPGRPDSSYVIKRMLSRGTFEKHEVLQMPPLATYQPDSAALRVLADWICMLGDKATGAACKLPDVPQVDRWANGIRPGGNMGKVRKNEFSAQLQGGILTLHGAEVDGKTPHGEGEKVSLADLGGKTIPLFRQGNARFAVPKGLPVGIYIVSARGKGFLVTIGN